MRGLERAGLAAAAAATAAGILLIGACGKQVAGNAQVNQSDLAAYTSEVTASSIAASSSKAAAAETAAVTACSTYRDAHEASVASFNAYIDASNNHAPDEKDKAAAAVGSLRDTANKIDQKITKEVPDDVATALKNYRDDANNLAGTLERNPDTDTLNGVIDKFNATKDRATTVCRAHGR
ncbi:hypothetical protein [Nocardia arthritidis]|uniref:Lipoprotein n=1 Tax=Nocardia arthritidis TaxID=228602 RepID=A0A6G9YR22_9NOCA|nr:hypothetical protein [Nocardia arthritidis]QIS15648.1 hypothetical protein F5544_39135 [Nocardia arthritidis]